MKVTAAQQEKADAEWQAEKSRLKAAASQCYGSLVTKFEALEEKRRPRESQASWRDFLRENQARIVWEFLDDHGFFTSHNSGTRRLINRKRAVTLVKQVVSQKTRALAKAEFDPASAPTDGYQFEAWVARHLRQYGWTASVTRAQGDQGIDVIAAQRGLSLGIQCKRYSGSVGNKAVQEAFSGAKHLGLDRAAVLTNAKVTRSGKALAASTDVLLLAIEDIPTLTERLLTDT